MSIQGALKEKVKQILTDRCGRDYERTYFHALKYSGYSNVIETTEEKMLKEWEDSVRMKELPGFAVVEFDWGAAADYVSEGLKVLGEDAQWVLFKQSDVALDERALFVLRTWATIVPEAVFLYGDEDILAETGTREKPWLKPNWSPNLYESVFYVGSVFGVNRSTLVGMVSAEENITDFVTRVLKKAHGFEKRADAIVHVPFVLCHHKDESNYEVCLHSRRTLAAERAKDCVGAGAENKEIASVIIPTKDHPDVLERNLRSLIATRETIGTGEQDGLEIIIVDNGSLENNRNYIEKLICDLTNEMESGIVFNYIYQPMEFHFSKMCNIGAAASNGNYLLFLNDDTEALEKGWITKMRREASKSYVGAVGCKLLYPDSDKIQHAGIVNLPMGPVHKLQFMSDEQSYYFDRNRVTTNVIAVTGACLMVARERFVEVGGFSEELPVAFNDVDLCFSLYEKGYYNVVMNGVTLYHYESLSRGDDEAQEKVKRLERERAKLYERHPNLVGVDPFYHILLNREGLDTRIVPALEEWLSGGSEMVWAKEIAPLPLLSEDTGDRKLRLHKGLYVRIESVGGNFVQGYSFMAGDDNACYEKRLLLEKEEDGSCFEVLVSRKLRQDLQENMPDQKNVAMSGFSANICGLPVGNYRIGVMATNKVSRVTYVNFCARTLCISK